MIAYPSRDMEVHRDIYQSVKSILDDIFQWIENKVGAVFMTQSCIPVSLITLQLLSMLPEEYKILEATASILPDHHRSVVNPFVGLVININVGTYSHRDTRDDSFCLVFPIGDFEGGELCLYEPGLVLPLRHGDFVVFPSCKLTHFNLHYNGRRASIVMHTDKQMSRWAMSDRNGWASNSSFR